MIFENFSHENLKVCKAGQFNLFAAELNLLYRIVEFEKLTLDEEMINRILVFYLRYMDIEALVDEFNIPKTDIVKEIIDQGNYPIVKKSKFFVNHYKDIYLQYCKNLTKYLFPKVQKLENRRNFFEILKVAAKKMEKDGNNFFPEYNYSLNGVIQIIGRAIYTTTFIGYLAFFQKDFKSSLDHDLGKFDGYYNLLKHKPFEKKINIYNVLIGVNYLQIIDNEQMVCSGDYENKWKMYLEENILKIHTKSNWFSMNKINPQEYLHAFQPFDKNIKSYVNFLGLRDYISDFSIFSKKGHHCSVYISEKYLKFQAQDDASEHVYGCDGEATLVIDNISRENLDKFILTLENNGASTELTMLSEQNQNVIREELRSLIQYEVLPHEQLVKFVYLATNFLNGYFSIYDGLKSLRDVLKLKNSLISNLEYLCF